MNLKPVDSNEILRSRAQALARRYEPPRAGQAGIEVLEFGIAQERYALETHFVQGVHPLKELTPLPCTPPFVLGIVNVRGRILPVLDLKKFFDLPETGLSDLHRIILVRGNEMELGLLADTIAGVRAVSVGGLQPALPTLSGIRSDYLKGLTSDCLIVLDLARILFDSRIIVDEEVEP